MFCNVQTARFHRHMLLLPPSLLEEYRLKVAILFTIPMTMSTDVCWPWRSADGTTDSTKSFVSYYDCLFDAQTNGYGTEPSPRLTKRTATATRRYQAT